MDADSIATPQFTAKTAKIAKNIAKDIALLTHRIMAAFLSEVERSRLVAMDV